MLSAGETEVDEKLWAEMQKTPRVRAALESKRLVKVGAVVAAKEEPKEDKRPAKSGK
jgi:hypothetical protein